MSPVTAAPLAVGLDPGPQCHCVLPLLYDFTDVCRAVARGDITGALAAFNVQAARLLALWPGGPEPLPLGGFLAALNQSVHDYLLFTRELSLHHCCHANQPFTATPGSPEALARQGEAILRAYCACLEAGVPGHPRIDRAAAYIEDHLAEDISLGDVCAHASLSRCQFCQLFRASLGCTFSEYLAARRIERAKALLIQTALPGHEIASRCGFSSASYFTTVFRKHTGLPPARYRAQHCEGKPIKIVSDAI